MVLDMFPFHLTLLSPLHPSLRRHSHPATSQNCVCCILAL